MTPKARRALKKLARVLLDMATAKGKADDYGASLGEVEKVFKGQPNIAKFLDAPIFELKERTDTVRLLAEPLNLDDLLVKTLELLVEQSLLYAISDFVGMYSALLMESKGILEVEVVTSVPLKQADRDAILDALKLLYPGLSLHLKEVRDPELLGGFVLYVEDREVDLSLLGELDQLLSWMMA
jgi:F-type H+-transporting ATPase subunit delta